jgi:hypothetical protein
VVHLVIQEPLLTLILENNMSDVINFAIPVSVNGVHYLGFTVYDGVVLSIGEADCVEGVKVILFANAIKAPQNVPYGGQFEVSSVVNPKYFKVKPL